MRPWIATVLVTIYILPCKRNKKNGVLTKVTTTFMGNLVGVRTSWVVALSKAIAVMLRTVVFGTRQ